VEHAQQPILRMRKLRKAKIEQFPVVVEIIGSTFCACANLCNFREGKIEQFPVAAEKISITVHSVHAQTLKF
jgi:hypothetical protein